MADYKTHIIFGFTLSAITYYVLRNFLEFSLKTTVISIIFIAFAAMFPDIDHRSSQIHKLIKSFLILTTIIAISVLFYPNLYSTLLLSLITGISLYTILTWFKPKHRGITHTFKFSVLFSIFIGLFTFFIVHTLIPAIFTLISYNSHLILDKLVKEL